VVVLFSTASRTALGPTHPPIQWVPGALSLGVKRSGREVDHSPPSSAEVKVCVELYLHSPNKPSWRGAQLKYRDNFTFTFTLPQAVGEGCMIWACSKVCLFLCVDYCKELLSTAISTKYYRQRILGSASSAATRSVVVEHCEVFGTVCYHSCPYQILWLAHRLYLHHVTVWDYIVVMLLAYAVVSVPTTQCTIMFCPILDRFVPPLGDASVETLGAVPETSITETNSKPDPWSVNWTSQVNSPYEPAAEGIGDTGWCWPIWDFSSCLRWFTLVTGNEAE
jgi:hypothetical protein